jgi:protease PrsW
MRFIRHKWLQIFIIGLLLLYAMEKVLSITNNLNLVPTIILLGSFLIPITFITYLIGVFLNTDYFYHLSLRNSAKLGSSYSRNVYLFSLGWSRRCHSCRFSRIQCFGNTRVLPMLAVGLIEEGAKLILPLGFYFKGRLRSEATGILLGTSSAMGFAAMETMGYAFVTLLQSRGNLLVLDSVLFARGVFSPAGHAAWTGIVCAVLWKQRLRTGRTGLNWHVMVAFLTAVLLHALWDIFNSFRGTTLALHYLVC